MFEKNSEVKKYISSEAKKNNIAINSGYNYFFSRDFIERISKNNPDNFVLSGSFGRFANLGSLNRPITDIDLGTSLSFDDVRCFIEESFKKQTQIPIIYSLQKFHKTANNTIDTVITGNLNGIIQTIKRDVSLNDEQSISLKLPTLFSLDNSFEVQSKDIEELIASKIFALFIKLLLVQNGKTSYIRYKDFFDYYYLLNNVPFNKEKIKIIFQKKLKESKFINSLSNKIYNADMLNSDFVALKREKFKEAKQKYEINDTVPYEVMIERINEEIKRNLK